MTVVTIFRIFVRCKDKGVQVYEKQKTFKKNNVYCDYVNACSEFDFYICEHR